MTFSAAATESAFYDLLDRPWDKEVCHEIGLRAYLNEFRTTIISMPRQSGKTTLLKKLAKRHPNSYIVAATPQMARNIAPDMGEDRPRVLSGNDLNHKFRGTTLRNEIWLLDEPQFMLGNHWNDFTEMLAIHGARDQYKPIIFGLGTGRYF